MPPDEEPVHGEQRCQGYEHGKHGLDQGPGDPQAEGQTEHQKNGVTMRDWRVGSAAGGPSYRLSALDSVASALSLNKLNLAPSADVGSGCLGARETDGQRQWDGRTNRAGRPVSVLSAALVDPPAGVEHARHLDPLTSTEVVVATPRPIREGLSRSG